MQAVEITHDGDWTIATASDGSKTFGLRREVGQAVTEPSAGSGFASPEAEQAPLCDPNPRTDTHGLSGNEDKAAPSGHQEQSARKNESGLSRPRSSPSGRGKSTRSSVDT